MRPLVPLLLGLVLPGCPEKAAEPPPKACTAFGQTCEFAPGKLGACVVKDDCSGPDCLVCQSLH